VIPPYVIVSTLNLGNSWDNCFIVDAPPAHVLANVNQAIQNREAPALLYSPDVAPSSVRSAHIRYFQLNDNYYSPCSGLFLLEAHILAYKSYDAINDEVFHKNMVTTINDLTNTHDEIGYLSVAHDEEGISALLTANISSCFNRFCTITNNNELLNRSIIMHQCEVKGPTKKKGKLDIGIFYRFLSTDEFVFKCNCISAFVFIEFTKLSTKSVEEMLPQASLYSNYLFRMMDYVHKGQVPLLGVIMSEKEMHLKIYSLTIIDNQYRIAETDLIMLNVSIKGFEKLFHIIVG